MKAHHVGLGAVAALVIHDLIVDEEEQLLFAGVRWVAQKLTETVQQLPSEPPDPPIYYGWPYYQRPYRDPFLGYRSNYGQYTPDL